MPQPDGHSRRKNARPMSRNYFHPASRRHPPAAAGLLAVLIVCCQHAKAANVLTGHNDNARTGVNAGETILTPAVVASTNFGELYIRPVDGYVYAQPLVMSNVKILHKGTHNVVFVATEHDSVYAFDADSSAGTNAAPLWQVSFINPASGITTVPSGSVNCGDLAPEIGITSTPVIDTNSKTIFVEAKTLEMTANGPVVVHRLHALNIGSGAERFGGPVVIQPIVAGTGDGNDGNGHVPFNPTTQLNRPGLLLSKGIVYVAFASHCDGAPYHGWLVGYNAQTLVQTNVFNTTPTGGNGGIWESGDGPATDTNGNIYVVTGNGTFDGTTNFGGSFLKFSTTNALQLAGFFAPSNQAALSASDLDLGSGGITVLPDNAGSAQHPHLLVAGSKDGTIYLVDRDQMGGYSTNWNNIVQTLPGIFGSCFCTPAYFNNKLYFQVEYDGLKMFAITNAYITPAPVSYGPTPFGFPGATPSISANGTSNAVAWVIQQDGFISGAPAVLHAYNATNLEQELYNSAAAGQDPGPGVKFSVPTIANGKVYVGGQYTLSVFGTGNFLATPSITPDGATFTNSVMVTLDDTSPGASIYYTLDNATPTTNSLRYTGPFAVANSLSVKARAFKPGSVDSLATSAVFLNRASIGAGTGLTGEYFNNQFETFITPPTLVRTDGTVDFNWTGSPPDPVINGFYYTVRWTGGVQPQFNEPYTFYANTGTGRRLWVDGQLVIDDWFDQGVTEWSGTIPLQAGRIVSLAMEYYEAGGVTAQLSWSSPSTAKAIIPQSQLYPAFAPTFLINTNDFTGGQVQLHVSGLAGKDYALQVSTNLTSWTAIATNFSAWDAGEIVPSSQFYFTDDGTGNCPAKFYRVRELSY